MKRILMLAAALLMLLPMALWASKNESVIPEYEIAGADQTAAQGTYVVKISIFTKKKNVDADELARAAVHGVLFRGFSGQRSHQKPLARTAAAEAQHAEYFKNFFAPNGTARSYTHEVGGSRQVVKSGKQYRTTAVMVVEKDQLRRDLEKAGVLGGLNTGF